MKLLDLFCGAGMVESSRANKMLALRKCGSSTTEDSPILFDEVRSTGSPRVAQRAGVSALRQDIRGARARRRQSPALLKAMREEAQQQDNQELARRSPRRHEEVQRDPFSKDAGRLEKEGGWGTCSHHRASWWGMRGVRCSERSLASRRFHSDHTSLSIPSSSSLRLHREAQGTIPRAVCESPL